MKLTNKTEAALITLLSAFESAIDYVEEENALELQQVYDTFRRETIELFRCAQCMRIREAGDEFEDFVCKTCAGANHESHMANITDLNEWVRRNR